MVRSNPFIRIRSRCDRMRRSMRRGEFITLLSGAAAVARWRAGFLPAASRKIFQLLNVSGRARLPVSPCSVVAGAPTCTNLTPQKLEVSEFAAFDGCHAKVAPANKLYGRGHGLDLS